MDHLQDLFADLRGVVPVVLVAVQVTEDVLLQVEGVDADVGCLQHQVFRKLLRLDLLFQRSLFCKGRPPGNGIGREKDIKLRVRVGKGLLQDILCDVLRDELPLPVRKALLLCHPPVGGQVRQDLFPAVGVVPSPAVVIKACDAARIALQIAKERRDRVLKHRVPVEEILDIVEGIAVIEIVRVLSHVGAHVICAPHKLGVVKAPEDELHVVGGESGIQVVGDLPVRRPGIGDLDRLGAKEFIKLRGLKVLRHAGTGDDRIVGEVLCDAVVLEPLVGEGVVEPRKRRMVVEEGIHHGGQGAGRRKEHRHHDDEVFQPLAFSVFHCSQGIRSCCTQRWRHRSGTAGRCRRAPPG